MIDLRQNMDYERGSSRCLGAAVVLAAVVLAAVLVIAAGCATPPRIDIAKLDGAWTAWTNAMARAGAGGPPPTGIPPNPAEPQEPDTSNPDAMDFGLLAWRHGGFDGSGARLDSPRLSGLTCDGKNLRYKWDIGMAGWGLSNGDAGAVCAVFFERDGKWIGGKFDWISVSRTNRELKHVESYSSWPSSGIKLPWRGRVAFVVVSADGKRRSNVLVAESR